MVLKGMGGITGVTGVDVTWASAWLSRPGVRSTQGRYASAADVSQGPQEGAQEGIASGPACGQRPQHESGRQRKKGRVSWPEGTGIFLGQASCLEECWAASGVAPPRRPPLPRKCLWRGRTAGPVKLGVSVWGECTYCVCVSIKGCGECGCM